MVGVIDDSLPADACRALSGGGFTATSDLRLAKALMGLGAPASCFTPSTRTNARMSTKSVIIAEPDPLRRSPRWRGARPRMRDG